MEEENTLYPHFCSVPIMNKKRFAELTGFSEGIVEGWLDRSKIPTMKVGKHKAVNVALITQQCLRNLPLDDDYSA